MRPQVSIDLVCKALERPRPGSQAHVRMMPRPRGPRTSNAPPRHGGVLLLLYPRAGRLHLVLTRRTDHLPDHSGQVSLPGGRQEPGESFEVTALREAQEELDVDPAQVQVLGRLTPLYIPPSNYWIHPVVGYAPARPTFRPNPHEVAEVLEVPLAMLLDPGTAREEEWFLRGTTVHVPFFEIGGHKVWGATAMVLAEFVDLIRSVVPPAGDEPHVDSRL